MIQDLKKAVFLDCDGVINKLLVRDGEFTPPFNLKELEIFPGVREGVSLLKEAGFLCIGITNQSDVGSGKLPHSDLETINDFIKKELDLEEIYFCIHKKNAGCNCRKPQPGLAIQAIKDFHIDPSQSFVVGDRWKDVEMGKKVGCRTVLVISDSTHLDKERNNKEIEPDFTVNNLSEAAQLIISLNVTF